MGTEGDVDKITAGMVRISRVVAASWFLTLCGLPRLSSIIYQSSHGVEHIRDDSWGCHEHHVNIDIENGTIWNKFGQYSYQNVKPELFFGYKPVELPINTALINAPKLTWLLAQPEKLCWICSISIRFTTTTLSWNSSAWMKHIWLKNWILKDSKNINIESAARHWTAESRNY